MLDICEIPLFSLGNLLCKHLFETNFKVYGFCNRCESPGEDVQQIQRWNCMEVSKYRIDPYNTKYTGSHDNNKCRSNALADSSGRGNCTVHKGAECIGESHNPNSMHTSCDNGWFCGKQRQEWAPKEEECSSEKQACTERISKCYEIAFFHSFFIPGSPVLAHETGTGHIEGKHNIVNQIVCIRSGSISGNHDRIKGVDSGLNKKVCNRENRILKTGWNTEIKNSFSINVMITQIAQTNFTFIIASHQMDQDQSS